MNGAHVFLLEVPAEIRPRRIRSTGYKARVDEVGSVYENLCLKYRRDHFGNLGAVGAITLHNVLTRNYCLLYFHYVLSISYDTDRRENIVPGSSSIMECVFVVAGMYLLCRCLGMNISLVSTIPTL